MIKSINSSFENNTEIQTPKGSYFTPTPLGAKGKVTYVYPGVGSAYIGLGRDIFKMYPDVLEYFSKLTPNIGSVLHHRNTYPKVSGILNNDKLKELDRKLRKDIKKMSESGIAFAALYTMIMGGIYGVFPDSALGYSIGEVSMLVSLGVWKKPALLSKRLAKSDLFSERLSGEFKSVREYLGITDKDTKVWELYTVFGPADEVGNVVENEKNVWQILINTENESVIAGFPENCKRVLKKMGKDYFKLSLDLSIHCDPVKKEIDKFTELYSLETGDVGGIKFYSSSCYKPIPIRTKSVAYSIARNFTEQVDFPRLINSAYDDGTRIFIETGSRQICTLWIKEILKNKNHLAVPMNVKGKSDINTIVNTLAKLVSHKVNVNLLPLYRWA